MNSNSKLNRSLAMGGTALAEAPVQQKPDVCGVCGAALRSSARYGWGDLKRYECGAGSDDGPGTPCPKTPKREPVEAPITTLQADAIALANDTAVPPTEVAETFPVVLVEGVLQEVKTIPELSKVDRLEAVLVHLEGFANMVVTKDDKKGADLAEKNRLLTKRIRVAATKICKEERAETVEELKKVQGFWISNETLIETRLKAVEEHLAAQVKIYTDEKDRIAKIEQEEKDKAEAEKKAEAARILQAKIQRIMDLGAVPNLFEIAKATDAEFEAMVAAAADAQAVKLAQQETERIERERLAAEQRARTELIEARTGEVSRAGILPWWSGLDALASMSDDEFRDELVERIEAKALAAQDAERIRVEAEEAEAKRKRDQEADDARRAAEQARLDAERAALDAERARLDAERDAREAAEREAEAAKRRDQAVEDARQAAEAQRIADEARAAAEAVERAAEAARLEALRPDREKAFAWLDALELDVAIPLASIESEIVRARLSDLTIPILQAIHAAKAEFAP